MSRFTDLRRFHVYYELIMALVSYCLNFTVIYLTMYRSTRAMHQYRVIILLNAVVDLIFNTTNLVTMQLADITFGKLFFTNSGLLERIPQPFSLLACVFWMFGLYLTVLNVAMQFLYRYNALCKQKHSQWRSFMAIYGVCVLYIAFQSSLGFVCFETNQSAPNYTAELKANGMFAENTPPFQVVDGATLRGAFHLGSTNAFTTGCYIVVFYTGVRIRRRLQEARQHMSHSTRAVQSQITVILGLQAAYPFLFLALPIFLAAGLPLLGVRVMGLGLVLCCMTTLLPLMNALTVIFVVPSFRRAILLQKQSTMAQRTSRLASQSGLKSGGGAADTSTRQNPSTQMGI